MPTYQYVARDHDGQQIQGVIPAKDVLELKEILRYKGLYLIRAVREESHGILHSFLSAFGRRSEK